MFRILTIALLGGALALVQVGTTQASTLGAGTTIQMAPSAVPAGWAATATRTVNLANAIYVGALAPSTPLHIVVGMQMQNPAGANRLVQAQNTPTSALYGTSVTPAQYESMFSPTSAQVSAVTTYLASKGFTNIAVESNRLMISATGTAAQASAAFNTQFAVYYQNGRYVYVNTKPALMPATLGSYVVGVLGLNNAGRMQPPTRICFRIQNPCLIPVYFPQAYWQAYDVGSTPTGLNTVVAVLSEGDLTNVVFDLRVAENFWSLPKVPVSIVQVGLHSPDTSAAIEWDLDSQYTTGMAGNVKSLVFYDTTSLDEGDISLMFNRWASQDIAKIANASFGECEFFAFFDGAMTIDDQIFLQAAAQGQTLSASSGDQGSACPVTNTNGVPASGPPFVLYPTSSPYVSSAGGTDLFTNTDYSYAGETAWEAGGGGISQFELSPFWQNGIVITNTCPLIAGAVCRAVPDIAMDAALETGALVFSGCQPGQPTTGPNGCRFLTGGTSLASPLNVGVLARLQSAHANALGFVSPHLYDVYRRFTSSTLVTGPPPTQTRGGFHDILTGSNGLFTALPGWDYTTGLGSYDVKLMNKDIK